MITPFLVAHLSGASAAGLGLMPDGMPVVRGQALGHVRQLLVSHGRAPSVVVSQGTIIAGQEQAMARDEESRLTVLVSGVITNAAELKAALAGTSRDLRPVSDAALVLLAWRSWGEKTAERLRGAALVIVHDASARRLHIITDRYGERAAYIWEQDGDVVVASDVKPLLAWPGAEARPDLLAIHDFLQLRFSPPPRTAFEGIHRVLPAQILSFGEHGPGQQRIYWRRAAQDRNQDIDEASRTRAAAKLLEYFDDAVGRLAESDLRVGALLSGGIDSGAIVARLARLRGERVPTFTAAFPQKGFNEVELAQLAADRYRTDHHVHIMGPELVDRLGELVWHYGVPFSDSSSLVTTGVMLAARQKADIVLGGDGAEQVFIGARRYIDLADARFRHEIGYPLPDVFQAPLGCHGPTTMRDILVRNMGVFRPRVKTEAYGDTLLPYLLAPTADRLGLTLESTAGHEIMDAAAEIETRGLLANDFLAKNNVAAQYAGIEVRMPFLDHEFSDVATSLPHELRVFERFGELRPKGLLRLMFEGQLDHHILYGANLGFGVPLRDWFRNEIRGFTIDVLTADRFMDRGMFSRSFVERTLKEHLDERRDHAARIWTMLVLELWFQTFIDRPASMGPLNIEPRRG